MNATAALAAACLYAAFVVRGIRRSIRRRHGMASTFRVRHSARWWIWTAAGRPSFWLEGFPTSRAGIYVLHRRVPLPLAWMPAHYRRSPQAQALVDAKQAYVRDVIDAAEMERRVERALREYP